MELLGMENPRRLDCHNPPLDSSDVICIFSSIWLWLYAGSGFLLKAARRFDIGFDWFNRKFDIEKKPLSAIGLVAGSTCWSAAPRPEECDRPIPARGA